MTRVETLAYCQTSLRDENQIPVALDIPVRAPRWPAWRPAQNYLQLLRWRVRLEASPTFATGGA